MWWFLTFSVNFTEGLTSNNTESVTLCKLQVDYSGVTGIVGPCRGGLIKYESSEAFVS